MDETPESFAYRCLPLDIANAHGWEILSPCGFDAIWNGEGGPEAVTIMRQPDVAAERVPVSLFGQGVLTFHIEGILRTPPGWNLWVGGSPNRPKDGISPLTGVIETDWSPFTFTMNWRFTRPDHWVHFDAFEPICSIFPVQRAVLEEFQPRFAPITSDPMLAERFAAWSKARDAFHQQMSREPPRAAADKWQKHYYRGVDSVGQVLVSDHRTKLRLRAFDATTVPGVPQPPLEDAQSQMGMGRPPKAAVRDRAERDLRKREWLLEAMERQRLLAPTAARIDRRSQLSSKEFLELYYAPGRPVILSGEMTDWPATSRWTPEYLAKTVGSRPVEFQSGRSANAEFEMDKAPHRSVAPFETFIDLISRPDAGNDTYLTAYNSGPNSEALATLHRDMRFLGKFLSRAVDQPNGMMWIGPAGTFTPLHHDLTNNLIAQVVGRKRFKFVSASDIGRLYNHKHVFSEISDLDDLGPEASRFARLDGVRVYDGILQPGDIIFMPLGWWHQVKALDFSVTVTYTNFLWPNDADSTYPGD